MLQRKKHVIKRYVHCKESCLVTLLPGFVSFSAVFVSMFLFCVIIFFFFLFIIAFSVLSFRHFSFLLNSLPSVSCGLKADCISHLLDAHEDQHLISTTSNSLQRLNRFTLSRGDAM
jgi:hypothetical protein